MASTFHTGQRLSYDSQLCTVRYIGPVKGTQKEWLGVEWDDTTRGKHDGESNGIIGRSSSKTTASFVRPTRVPDRVRSFTEAIREKYASEITEGRDAVSSKNQIEISGKFVENVGFDKIRQQQAQLHELKIVILDGLRISYSDGIIGSINTICPKVIELDLSRNLFDSCDKIMEIVRELDNVRVLRLNGNRLQIKPELFASGLFGQIFKNIKDLSLDQMLLTWEEFRLIVDAFPGLTALSASLNDFKSLEVSQPGLRSVLTWGLTSLTLNYNKFTSLADISWLVGLPCLERLYLKGNQIQSTGGEQQSRPVFSERLHYLDLSYNDVSTWAFVDELSTLFPGLSALRFSHNPIYENPTISSNKSTSADEGYMLTLARVANLKALNFSTITPAERTNAEMFYLSRIGRAMVDVPEGEEHVIIGQHKRYNELCQIYGTPTILRVSSGVNPDFLEARLIRFTFYIPQKLHTGQGSMNTKIQEIPKGFDVYQVKGIVGRLFGLPPMSLRLIWETGEWDPVAGYDDEGEDSEEEEQREGSSFDTADHEKPGRIDPNKEKGRWMRREVELENGTRQIGFWVEGQEARVRIEHF